MLSTHAAVPGDPSVVRKAFTPTDPLRLWVAGDSLIIDTGYALERAALATPVIKDVGGVDGKIGTGLDRPDVFNWFLEIRGELKALHPNAVVLGFGGNDDKQYMTGLPDGVSITEFNDPAWRREYARRVGGLIDLINRSGAYVVWVGLPITRDPEQTARFDAINGVVAQEVDKRPGGAAYLDTYSLLAGPNGGFAQYLTNALGRGSGRARPGRRALLARGRGDRRPAGAEGPERGVRPDELAAAGDRDALARGLRRAEDVDPEHQGQPVRARERQVKTVGAEPGLAGAPGVPVGDLHALEALGLGADRGIGLRVQGRRLLEAHPDDLLRCRAPSRP